MPTARRFLAPPMPVERLRDHILFGGVLRGDEIACIDGTLIVTIGLQGVEMSAKADDVQDGLTLQIKDWLHEVGDAEVMVRVFTPHLRHDHRSDLGALENRWLKRCHEIWAGGFSRAYDISHVIVLSAKGAGAREKLAKGARIAVQRLSDFQPAVLPLGRSGEMSPLLGFWAGLLNVGRTISVAADRGTPFGEGRMPIGPLNRRLADALIASQVVFSLGSGLMNGGENGGGDKGNGGGGGEGWMEEDGYMQIRHGPHTTWGAAVTPTKWPERSFSAIIQAIMQTDAEFVLVQWARPLDAPAAQTVIEMLRRSLTTGRGNQQLALLQELLAQKSGPEAQRLVLHQLAVFVYGATKEEVDAGVARIEGAFMSQHMAAIRETACLEPLWFAQFPPHGDIHDVKGVLTGGSWACPMLLCSGNVATMVQLEAPSRGVTRSPWGERPVTYFWTPQRAPYAFSWHKEPKGTELSLGNTLVVGAAGAGKSVAVNFLATASLGFADTRMFLFDRYDGSFVPTMAFGGSYVYLQTDHDVEGTVADLAPLQLDIGSGRGGMLTGHGQWLLTWLRDGICRTSDPLAEKELASALRGLADVAPSDRSMDALMGAIGEESVRAELQRWCQGGAYGRTLNGKRDTLDFRGDGRLVTFDFTRILEDPRLLGAILPYLSYRIETAMLEQGAAWGMIVDEAAALLSDPGFFAWYSKLLQEVRKSRGIVVSCFQTASSLQNVGDGNVERVLVNSPTQLLFPTTDASRDLYCGMLGVSDTGYRFLIKDHPISRTKSRVALLKREGEGEIMLDLDLGLLRDTSEGNYLSLFDAGKGPSDKLRALMRHHHGDRDRAVADYIRGRFV